MKKVFVLCFLVFAIFSKPVLAQSEAYNKVISLMRQKQYVLAENHIAQAKREVRENSAEYLNLLRCELQCSSNLGTDKLNEFLSLSKTLHGSTDSKYWNDVLWAASFCFDVGDQVQACKMLKISEEGFRTYCNGPFHGKDTVQQIASLELQAHISSARNLMNKKVRYFKQATELVRNYYGDNSLEYIDFVNKTAQTCIQYSKPQQAKYYHNQALHAISEDIKFKFRQGTPAQREEYWTSISRFLEGTLDGVFSVRQNRFYSSQATKAAYDALLIYKSALLTAYRMGQNYTYTTTDDILAHLSPSDACVEFFKTRFGNYGVLVLRHGWKSPVFVPLNRSFKIGNKTVNIEDFIPYVPPTYDHNDFMETLKSLCAVIWPQDLLDLLPRKESGTVYYSTIGELDLCPIDCLPLSYSDAQSHIITVADEYNLCRVSSTREIVKDRIGREDLLSELSLFGAADYNVDQSNLENEGHALCVETCDNSSDFIRMRDIQYEEQLRLGTCSASQFYPPLPGSLKEICAIDSLLCHNCNIVTGRFATREGLESIARKASTLVVSTHGFDGNGNNSSNPSGDPLENCGILVSGSDYGMTYKLSARVFSEIDLSNVGLVVLASCKSIGNKLTKDGVYGLQRACKMAGAQTIIVSLWPIRDDVSSAFNTLLFQNLAETDATIYEAFISSRKALREKFPEMYNWCTYVLIDALQQ